MSEDAIFPFLAPIGKLTFTRALVGDCADRYGSLWLLLEGLARKNTSPDVFLAWVNYSRFQRLRNDPTPQ